MSDWLDESNKIQCSADFECIAEKIDKMYIDKISEDNIKAAIKNEIEKSSMKEFKFEWVESHLRNKAGDKYCSIGGDYKNKKCFLLADYNYNLYFAITKPKYTSEDFFDYGNVLVQLAEAETDLFKKMEYYKKSSKMFRDGLLVTVHQEGVFL